MASLAAREMKRKALFISLQKHAAAPHIALKKAAFAAFLMLFDLFV
jgi:hypothetical protein